ncbi:protein-disulfide reductase DsbD domain-containing protein [Tritonibacter scottomollicae]|uniref:protein-disulfide reductase DsbD domain-containing protein n=1 Tax=Tritonibacter scottomollicae TaxID=483013 RepID=UPI003AA90341
MSVNLRSFLASAALALASLTSGAVPSMAGNNWDNVATINVLDGGPTADGRYLGALHLRLEDGWKTYWRAPGDAGIPPQFHWQGSRNVADLRITWPTPEVFLTSGMRTIGYHDELVLPIEITPKSPGKPIRLKGRMELGLCKDVCIPSELRFDHRADLAAGRHPAIAAALAARPYSASEARVRGVTCHLSPTPYGMKVLARISMPSAGTEEYAVIEGGGAALVATETKSWREGSELVAEAELLPARDGPVAVDRSALRFTVLGTSHAVDIRGCTSG